MDNYLSLILQEIGMPLWLFLIIYLWASFWKLYGLWVSARKKSLGWFIIISLTNSIGILEILYIYVFSKSNPFQEKKSKKSKKKK